MHNELTAAKMATTVVWDFDHSLITDNSDTYIPERLSPGAAIFIEQVVLG